MFSLCDFLNHSEFDDLLYANIPQTKQNKDNEEYSESNSCSSSFIDDFPTQAEVDSERPVEPLDATYFV